jgi:uncharacterized protein (TIGR02145 family)
MMKANILFIITTLISLSLDAQTFLNIHKKDGSVLSFPLNDIDSLTYSIGTGNRAELFTFPVSGSSSNAAVSGGNITDDGGSDVTQRGVCWSTTPSPLISGNKTEDGIGSGAFISFIINLQPGTKYFVRSYAVSSEGVAYGNEVSFTTPSTGTYLNSSIVNDTEGNAYSTIQLGNQVWMQENLKATRFRNGDPIPLITSTNEWINLFSPGISYFNNDPLNVATYGVLYNWYTVNDPRGICPTGWHVPSNAEWLELSNYLGASTVTGGLLKTTGTLSDSLGFWNAPNTGATNRSGFSAQPAGSRSFTGSFIDLSSKSLWWTTTEDVNIGSLHWYILNNSAVFFNDRESKRAGLSVRCVKD